MKKKIIIILAILLIIILFILGAILIKNNNVKEANIQKNNIIIIEEETVKSVEIYDYNFYLASPMVVEVTQNVNQECQGIDKLEGKCESNNEFQIKGIMEGKTTLWIIKDFDIAKSTKENTTVYKVIVDKDLNVTLEEIAYRPYEN